MDINWGYSYKGDKGLAPAQTFANGLTYFKFPQNSISRWPAIFMVNKARKETLINYYIEKHKDSYVVFNRTAKLFTLRDGNLSTCIFK